MSLRLIYAQNPPDRSELVYGPQPECSTIDLWRCLGDNAIMTPEITQSPSDPDFVQNPYPFYERMRMLAASSPGRAVIWTDYGIPCFCGFDDVDRILRDRRFGRQILHVMTREELNWPPIPEPLQPFYAFESHSLLELEPPSHTRLRRLVNRAFVSRAIADVRPSITALAHQLIDDIDWNNGPVDLLPAFCEPIPVTVIAWLLGVPTQMAPQLLAWSHDMVAMYQHNRDDKTEARAVTATIEFSDYMRKLIDVRRKGQGEDLLSALIRAEEDGGHLSREELVTTAILLLNAGHEATVHGFGNGIKAILETGHSGAFAAHEQAARAVEEVLRFDPPLHLFTRYVLTDLEWNSLQLKKGQTVGLLLAAANRDPDKYHSASAFQPDRIIAPHTAFGAGTHFCVGAPLARAEMIDGLSVLFERLPDLRLAEPPRFANRYHFHGLDKLMVTPG